jgi:class 3 adenylate cyclase
MFSRLWTRLVDVGVDATTDPTDVRQIRMTNGIAALVSVWQVSTLPLSVPYFQVLRVLVINSVLFPLLCSPVWLLNARKHHLAARVYYNILTIVVVTMNASQLGREVENHFFLLPALLAAFFMFHPREWPWMVGVLAFGLCAFIGLEVWFRDHAGVFPANSPLLGQMRILGMSNLFLIILVIAGYNFRLLWRTEAALAAEREKSERLLLNVLPARIAQRLKESPGHIAERFDAVTILFADIVGFTVLSQRLSPEALVAMLNEIFTDFDVLARRHGLEKIKTIGDAYMVVGGIPTVRPDHCEAVLSMALELEALMATKYAARYPELRLRTGVHTGPVVAGVIGESKFIYDLWGDSVNTASRMESHGVPGRIQASEAVYNKARDTFRFEPRGEIDVKGKGAMQVFLLTGRKDADGARCSELTAA